MPQNTQRKSYKVYKDAYQKLCGVLDRLDNVSQEEYLKLRNAFETAEANLVEKDAAKPEQPKPDKPQTGSETRFG